MSLLFLNSPKDTDPSYKMDLDFWDKLEGKKLCFIAEEILYVILFHLHIYHTFGMTDSTTFKEIVEIGIIVNMDWLWPLDSFTRYNLHHLQMM